MATMTKPLVMRRTDTPGAPHKLAAYSATVYVSEEISSAGTITMKSTTDGVGFTTILTLTAAGLLTVPSVSVTGTSTLTGRVGIGVAAPTLTYVQVAVGNPSLPTHSQRVYLGSVADTVGAFVGGNTRYSDSGLWKPSWTGAAAVLFTPSGGISFLANSGLTAGTDYTPTVRLALTASGNLGIGTTDVEAAWSTAHVAVELGTIAALMAPRGTTAGTDLNITSNAYWTGTQWNYKTSAPAANVLLNNGEAIIRVVASGTVDTQLTWSTALKLGLSAVVIPKFQDADRNFLRWNQGTVWYQAGFRASPYTWALEFQSSASTPANDTGWTQLISATSGGEIRFPNVGTTASAANAFLDSASSNNLLRSTSSLRYKTDVEEMTLAEARAILGLRAITFRSRAEADDPKRQFLGLAAEEVAAVDDRYVHLWDGRPDGVAYDRLTVPLLLIAKDHGAQLAQLRGGLADLRDETEERLARTGTALRMLFERNPELEGAEEILALTA